MALKSVSDYSISCHNSPVITSPPIGGAEVLILDEPTAVLTPQETERLLAALRAMAARGKAVLLITHKMSEVMQYADRITVLRGGGRSVASRLRGDTDVPELTRLTIGSDSTQTCHGQPCATQGTPVLELRQVQAQSDKGAPALNTP